MRRAFYIISLFTLLVILIFAFRKPLKNSVYGFIKDQIEIQASFLLNREVRIGSVSGNLITHITLRNLEVAKEKEISDGKIIFVREAKVNYNLVRLLKRRDILSAITSIKLIGPDVFVSHEKYGRWNFEKLFLQGGSSEAPAPEFQAKIFVRDGKVRFLDEKGFFSNILKPFELSASQIEGNFDFSKKDLLSFNVLGLTQEGPLKAQGKISLSKTKGSISVFAKNMDLKNWNDYLSIPFVKQIDLKGTFDLELKVDYSEKVSLSALLDLKKSSIFDLPSSGRIKVLVDNSNLSLEVNAFEFCSGNISGKFDSNFGAKNNLLEGKFKISSIDIKKLFPDQKEFQGFLGGNLVIKGDTKKFFVDANGSFQNSEFFGQRIDRLDSRILFDNGSFNIENLILSYKDGQIKLQGSYEDNNRFDLNAAVKNYSFKSKIIGENVSFVIDDFAGRVSGVLNHEMIKHPFKNIFAEGSLLISGVEFGNQKISRCQGQVALKDGRLISQGFSVIFVSSGLLLQGSIGFDKDSYLQIIAKDFDVSELKILENYLPEENKKISGIADLNVGISGYLLESPKLNEMIKNLDVSFSAELKDAVFGINDIKLARIFGGLKNGNLVFDEVLLKTKSSNLSAKGSIENDGKIMSAVFGEISLKDFLPFTQRYAKVLGNAKVSGEISGTIYSPQVKGQIDISDFYFNDIFVDKIQSNFGYKDGFLNLFKPTEIFIGKDSYALTGRFNLLNPFSEYSGNLYTNRGNMSSVLYVIKSFAKELPESAQNENREKTFVVLPKLENYKLSDGDILLFSERNGFLSKWLDIASENGKLEEQKNSTNNLFGISASAPVGINVYFTGSKTDLNVIGSFFVGKGNVSDFEFDKIYSSFEVSNGFIKINEFKVEKGSGNLSLSGNVALNGSLDLSLNTKSFDIKNLDKAIFGIEPIIYGDLDTDAKISNTVFRPKINCSLVAKNAGIGEISLNEIKTKFYFQNDVLNLEKLKMSTGKQIASLKGKIPFVLEKSIDLQVNLDGQNIGLLAALFRGVLWNSGTGKASLNFSGTLKNPKIEGYIKVQNAQMYIDQLKSSLFNVNSEINFVDSQMNIKSLSGIFSGDRTNQKSVPFSIAGIVGLKEIFSKRALNLNLALADTFGSIDIPNIYSGDFSLTNSTIFGRLKLAKDNSTNENVLVRSNIVLSDGTMFLPKGGSSNFEKPNIEFDVDAKIGRNIRLIQGGQLQSLTMDLTNINLEILGENLKITGTMDNPVINGNVLIKSGSLNILSRDFIVVDEYEQEKYFSDISMISKNEAVFTGGEKPYSIMPYINLTARSEISSYPTTNTETIGDQTNGSTKIKDTIIVLTRVSGVPYATDRSKMIKLNFYAYKLDNEKSPPEIIPVSYDENKIRLMLLPDFIKSTLGLTDGGPSEGIDTNAIIVDYLNNRLQTYLLRNVTTNLEKAFGLESLTLNYNFGRDLEKIFPTKRGERTTESTPQFGVGFVKGIFSNVFLQVRYAQALDQWGLDSNTSLNYQITWKATPWYSIIYYREPITFQQLDSNYYKILVQSQFVL